MTVMYVLQEINLNYNYWENSLYIWSIDYHYHNIRVCVCVQVRACVRVVHTACNAMLLKHFVAKLVVML